MNKFQVRYLDDKIDKRRMERHPKRFVRILSGLYPFIRLK